MSTHTDANSIAALLGEEGMESAILSLSSGTGILDYFDGFAKTQYVSDTIKEALGLPKHLPLKSGVDYYVHPDDMRSFRSELEKNAGKLGESFDIKLRLLCADGEYLAFDVHAVLARIENGHELWFVAFRSAPCVHTAAGGLCITAKTLDERIHSAISRSTLSVFDYDHESGRAYISPGFKKFELCNAAQEYILSGKGSPDVVHSEELSKLEDFFSKKSAEDSSAAVTLRCKMTDGSYRWTKLVGIFAGADDGTPLRTIISLTDVDKEMRIEQELQMSLRHLNTVIEDTNAQYWEYDLLNDTAYMGEMLRKVFSLPEIMENFPESLLKTGIIPEEYFADFRKLHILLKNGALFSEAKLPMNSRGGTPRWKHLRYRTVFDSEGRPFRAIGTAIDITETVNAENKLKQFKKAQKAAQQAGAK